MDKESAVIKMDFYMDSVESPTIKRVWQSIRSELLNQQTTDVRQIKAEIATLADELTCIEVCECDIANGENIIKRMRKLSAVKSF